jgi:LPXTG-motif cell wall-anchored protein
LMIDPTIDAGLIEVGAVAGVVFIDQNRNGLMDAGELPIGGVVLSLFDRNGNLVATVTSSADGSYLFPSVPVGDGYVLRQEQPNGFTSTTADSLTLTVVPNQIAQSLFGEISKVGEVSKAPATLPATGAQVSGLISLAFLLTVAGSLLLAIGRRRQERSRQE